MMTSSPPIFVASPSKQAVGASAPPTRREAVVNALKGAALAATAAATLSMSAPALADSLPENNAVKLLCNAECEEALKEATLVTTPSGLQYKDIVVGEGAQPEPGFQASRSSCATVCRPVPPRPVSSRHS